MIDWLIGVSTARQHRKVNLCQQFVPAGEGKTAQSAKDGQQDTTHNTEEWNYTW